MQCLNLSNKEVKAAVDELTQVLGDEDAAYYVISENNGYAIDKAPNGEPSELFSALLSHFNGDRGQAIKAKSKVFTESFKKWFGDWLNPDVKHKDLMLEYFQGLESYNKEIDHIRELYGDDAAALAKAAYEYITTQDSSKPDFGFIPDNYNTARSLVKSMFGDKAINTSYFAQDTLEDVQLDIDASNHEDAMVELYSLRKSTGNSNLQLESTEEIKPEYYNRYLEALDKLKSTDMLLGIYLFADYVKSRSNVSKVVDKNGEPLVVYHHSNDEITEFSTEFDNYFSLSKGGTKEAIFFTGNKSPKLGTVLDRKFKYPVYLSAKKVIEKTGTKDELRASGEGFVGTINRSAKEADAAIFHDIDDNQETNQDIYVVHRPNQIKSVENLGTFSPSDNNIHKVETAADTMLINSTLTYAEEQPFYGNSSEVLQRIIGDVPEDSIARKLIGLFQNTNIPVHVIDNNDIARDPKLNRIYMAYNEATNEIWVNPDNVLRSLKEYNAVSFVHEMVHAFTSRAITNVMNGVGTKLEKAVFDRVGELLEINRGLYADQEDPEHLFHLDLYGLNDHYEFVAEFLTNEAFVDNMLEDARQRNVFEKVRDKIIDVWNAIIDFLTGSEHVNNNASTRDLLMLLLSFNVLNNNEDVNRRFEKSLDTDIDKTRSMIHEFERYDLANPERLRESMKKIRSNLIEGFNSRLQSVDIQDIGKRTEVIEHIKYMLTALLDNTINDLDVIEKFINDFLKGDALYIGRQIISAYQGKSEVLTDEELVSLKKNYLVFYKKQAEEIFALLLNMSGYREEMGVKDYDSLYKLVELCKTVLDSSYRDINEMQTVHATRAILDRGIKVGSPTIFNYISEHSNETDFDINIITRLLGHGDKINDEAIKTLFDLVQETENNINAVCFQKANELNKLLKAAGNRNQKLLFEVDENGRTTGYIIRDLNYGKFFNDLKKFKESLQKEFGIDYQTLQLPENIELRTEYNKRLNAWLSLHCERKYTDEFYNLMNSLSNEAAAAREMALSKIRALSNKHRDNDGYIHYELMTDEEWLSLRTYELELKLLASIYDIYGNEKPEGTVERRIAEELTELNKKLLKGLIRDYNHKKFEDLVEEKRRTLSSADFKKWAERNTRVVYTEEFYEELAKIERIDYGEEYAALSDQRRKILNMFRDNRTGEVAADLMKPACKNVLSKIDNRMAAIRKASKKRGKNKLFDALAKVVATEQYKLMLSKYAVDQNQLEAFLLDNAYRLFGTDTYIPRSWYTKIQPRDSKYIKVIPATNLSEMSSESPFFNKNYDITVEEHYQPKRSLYDNSKAFNKVMSNKALADLRLAIIDTMAESNSKLNNLEYLNKYRLPQISGSYYKYLKAYGFNPLRACGSYLLDKVSRRNDDVGIQKKVKTTPDGTTLALVPQYFTKQLDNPGTISADMVGSVMLYFKMAENFKLKNEIKAKAENIKAFLAQRKYTGSTVYDKVKSIFSRYKEQLAGTNTELYKFAEKFININIYDNKADALSFNVAGREISVTKILRMLTLYGTLRNLGLNFACAFTGFFTAAHNHLVNMLTGRYYTFGNALAAFKDIVFDLFMYGPSLGRRAYKSPQMAYMDFFEVGSTTNSLWKHTNRPALINIISGKWAFGLYSLSDYMIKGLILNCLMYDYKLIDGHFMHHEAYYTKYGRTEETKHAWSKAKSFKALTQYNAGKISAIDERYQAAVDEAKHFIGNSARALSASADGQLAPLQKTLFSANVFGAMCMMHRNYIPIILQEYYGMSEQWDYQTQRKVEALLKTPFRVFSLVWRDKHGLEMFTILAKLALLNKGFSSELDRTNMKKLKIELALTLALYPVIRNALATEADHDRRNRLLNLFAYVMSRTAFESFAPYNLVDIYRTVKTPTPLYSLLDNVGGVISYPFDLIQSNIRDKKSKRNKRIVRGAYKGDLPIERDLWKATPFKNIIELNDIPSKRRYYDTQIIGD